MKVKVLLLFLCCIPTFISFGMEKLDKKRLQRPQLTIEIPNNDKENERFSVKREPSIERRQRSREFNALEKMIFFCTTYKEFKQHCQQAEEFKNKHFQALVNNDLEMDGKPSPGEILFNTRIIGLLMQKSEDKKWDECLIPFPIVASPRDSNEGKISPKYVEMQPVNSDDFFINWSDDSNANSSELSTQAVSGSLNGSFKDM